MISGVEHPSHYNVEGKKECIVAMQEEYGRLYVYLFDRGNGYKYCYRAGEKQGESYEKDVAKASWYACHAVGIYESWNWFQRLVCKIALWVCK